MPDLEPLDSPPSKEGQKKSIRFAIGVDPERSPLKTPNVEDRFNFESPISLSDQREKMMIELYDLHGLDGEWVESARWIKYEQDVEGINHHWSLPHVGFVFVDSLLALEKSMEKALVFDINAATYSDLIEGIVSRLQNKGWKKDESQKVAELMRLRQTHVQSKNMGIIRSMTSMGLTKLTTSLHMSHHNLQPQVRANSTSFPDNSAKFTKTVSSPKLISGMKHRRNDLVNESTQVFAGEVNDFNENHLILVRLDNATYFPEIEVACPIRYFVFILGPEQDVSFHQMGRSFCAMMANEGFRSFAEVAHGGDELIMGLKQFLKDAALIPGSKIDNETLVQRDRLCEELNHRAKMRKIQKKRLGFETTPSDSLDIETAEIITTVTCKKQTGFFSGLKSDFFRRIPHYCSDFTDAWDFQCIRALIFMFLACITPTVTFGGLMGEYTMETMGMAETLIAQCGIGVIWGLFSAQPLIVQSPTGPVLIFEGALYGICTYFLLDFLTVKLYTGFWIFLMSLTVVCFDLQRVLKLVTKFTEEIFAALISLIFFNESYKFINKTFAANPATNFVRYEEMWKECNETYGVLQGQQTVDGCADSPHPNTALLSLILMIMTLILSLFLRFIRESQWLGRESRKFVGDYSVAAALVIIVCVNQYLFPSIYVERLEMPEILGFTDMKMRGHGLIVHPSIENLGLSILISLVAGGLVFILIFVETGITELVLARKERKLTKGCGQSWDMLLSGICCLICSIFGIPWMCAGAVQSIAHANSLTIKKKKAPGERPEPVLVVEQRVTAILLSLMIGFFGVIGSFFKFLPMACLFGVFAYLGLTSLFELDLCHRIFLLFKPSKYHPKKPYVDEVSTTRMNAFTIFQVILVTIALLLKFNKTTALFFPFVLCVFVGIRQWILPIFYKPHELAALDEGHEKEDHVKIVLENPV